MRNNIESVGLCYCFNQVDDENVDPIKLGEFLVELYDQYFKATKTIHVREFDMVTRLVLNRHRHECAMSCRQSCGSFLNIGIIDHLSYTMTPENFEKNLIKSKIQQGDRVMISGGEPTMSPYFWEMKVKRKISKRFPGGLI